jgi:hypothetical protein
VIPAPPSPPGPPQPSAPSPKNPPNHKTAWIIAAAVGVAAAIAGTALALAATNDRHRTSNATAPSAPGNSPAPAASTQDTLPTDIASDTTVPTTTIETPPPSTTTPSPYAGNSVVTVAPAAANNPAAPTLVEMLTRYFNDINTRDFDDYRLLFAHGLRPSLDPQQLAIGYRSTIDSDAKLASVAVAPDGRPAATVTFTSQQNAADGPDGETCTNWTLTFYLQAEGNTTVFGPHPAGYEAQHSAC